MIRRWRRDQKILFQCEPNVSAKRTTMGHFEPKYAEQDHKLLEWFWNNPFQLKS